jgi:hypothetical protein
MAERAERLGLLLDKSKLPTLRGEEFCGAQHESWTATWRLVRRFDRDLLDRCRIHGSVRKRLELEEKKFDPFPYAPPKLTKPWERFFWD